MIIVSRSNKVSLHRQCKVTSGRVRNVTEMGFEPGSEDSYGRCRSDKIRQTVPDLSLIHI